MILQPIFCNGFDILMDELLITTEVVFPVGCWCLVDVQLRTEGSVEIIEVKTAPCSSASSPDLPLLLFSSESSQTAAWPSQIWVRVAAAG